MKDTIKQLKLHFSIIGGFVGLLIAALCFWDGKGNKIMTASYGIAIGAMIGYLFIGILEIIGDIKGSGARLVKIMNKLNPIRGKHINEIVSAVGSYTSKSPIIITDRNNEQGQVYKFVDGKYQVDIMVGADGICVGILNEYMDGKKLQ